MVPSCLHPGRHGLRQFARKVGFRSLRLGLGGVAQVANPLCVLALICTWLSRLASTEGHGANSIPDRSRTCNLRLRRPEAGFHNYQVYLRVTTKRPLRGDLSGALKTGHYCDFASNVGINSSKQILIKSKWHCLDRHSKLIQRDFSDSHGTAKTRGKKIFFLAGSAAGRGIEG